MPYGQVSKQLGSNKQVYEYLFHKNEKDKEKYEESNITLNFKEELEQWLLLGNGQGARNDIIEFTEMIKKGVEDIELIDNFPSLYSRSMNYVKKIQELNQQEKASNIRDLKVHYYYGESGTGKSYTARIKYDFKDVYVLNDYERGCFDNYNGQKILILEEYRGNFKLSFLLQLLDKYSLQLPARYSNKWALFEEVYIISNIPLHEQYHNIDSKNSLNALFRRINNIKHFKYKEIITFKNINNEFKVEKKEVNPLYLLEKSKQETELINLFGDKLVIQ